MDEVHFAGLTIKEVLGGVEALNACFGDAVLAPELVPFGAVLSVAVCHYVSAVSAPNDEDFPHLMMWKLFLVSLYLVVAQVKDHVAIFAVIGCFENCLVSLVYPVLGHSYDIAP